MVRFYGATRFHIPPTHYRVPSYMDLVWVDLRLEDSPYRSSRHDSLRFYEGCPEESYGRNN